MDRGLSLAEVDGLMEVAGSAVDIVKLGFGTAAATENLEAKLDRWRAHGVPVVLGGTLTEIAILQGRVDEYVAWVRSLGLDLIEVSDGSITLDHGDKTALIRRLVGEGFKVMSEVGSKDNAEIMAPYRWVEQIQAELEAGAWKVICEGRETGTAGIARPDGELRQGLIDEIAHAVDPAPDRLRGAAEGPAGRAHQALRARRQPRQHPAGRGAPARDDAPRAAQRHAGAAAGDRARAPRRDDVEQGPALPGPARRRAQRHRPRAGARAGDRRRRRRVRRDLHQPARPRARDRGDRRRRRWGWSRASTSA